MVSIFTVFYRKTPNYNRSSYQNADRRAGVRCFKSLPEALEFAATVDTKYITDYTGRKMEV